MYDATIKTIDLASDELDLMKELLESHKDIAVSVGEELTIEDLLTKLNY